jgi:hypothetical protein
LFQERRKYSRRGEDLQKFCFIGLEFNGWRFLPQ